MITPDTSVVIAAFSPWHDHHKAARESVSESRALIAHVALETYSVLTRLPVPQRLPPRLVADLLAHYFPGPMLVPNPTAYQNVPHDAAKRGISGGAIYDAFIAATAENNRATLVSLDTRATPTYQALGVNYRLLD